MTKNKTTLIVIIVSSIVLFILTLTQFENFFELLIPNIENIRYETTKIDTFFRLALFFSAVFGLFPILLYLTWQLAKIETTKRRIFSGLIITLCIVLAVLLRQTLIKSTFNGLINLKTQTGETIHNSFNIENLDFEYYLLGGLILGCVVSFFTFKEK